MAAADDEEYVQLTIPEVFVYKVPPRTSAQGHKASDWKEQVWVGRLVVVTRDRVGEAAVKLITPETGKLFAVAPVRRDGPPAAEKVTDSSRYFALRIENDKGQHAFIGIGFNNRSDAFDFNVALQDWAKHKEAEDGGADALLDLGPAGGDLRLKAGEKITIKVSVNGSGSGGGAAARASGGGSLKPLSAPGGAGGLRPPAGALRAPASASAGAGAPAAAAAAAPATAAAGGDDLLGLGAGVGALSLAAPAPPSPAAAAPPADDWVSF